MRTNDDRIEEGRRLIEAYNGDDDLECALTDAIADLLHLASSEGIDIQIVADRAISHVEAELEEEE